jgi:RimJ/RimL family protein N-acetyltransferase
LHLTTPRLRLIAATRAMIAAELRGQDRLATVLEAVIPADWPPEHHDRETLMFWLEELSRPGADGWWLYYAVVTAAQPTLVGSVGYKGPPRDGVAEIGYSIVPSWQRRGLATEASRALLDEAWQRGARAVIAHTLAHLEPSLGVLRKLGFEQCGTNEAGGLEFRLSRK